MKCQRCQGTGYIHNYRPDGVVSCWHYRDHFSEPDSLGRVRTAVALAGLGSLLAPPVCDTTWLEQCYQVHPADALVQEYHQGQPDTPGPFAFQLAPTTTNSTASLVVNSSFLKTL